MATGNRRTFRSFGNRSSSGFNGQAAAQQPQRPAPVALAAEFPGATVEDVEVCVFGGEANLDNGKAECHLTIRGNVNGSRFTAEVGRYDPRTNSPRISLESVWGWAKKYGLVHSHNGPESASQTTGEKVGGFAATA